MARTKPSATKIKSYLIGKGHDAAKVNGKAWNSDEQKRQSLCELHNVTRAQYREAAKK